ncbi:MAG: hypothetical protein A2161_06585 [Candidatus Schekmanbacteria bacterium RBG_13_48_7]|uniref:Bacterial type II secretion system protein E domain-containing protein n=1 Tax=Candidatus Schekmanbacteria bacterium RBG_13_48_7 TaxID=1817878 RepID=A0A1F7RTT4_9BACT|nr:MAG: hypothetical protein A2161_06585 [Candidatus Schekmanbacteria bacterium RBG_13_48_7]
MVNMLDELPSFEVGGRVRFLRDRLMDWIKNKEKKMAWEREQTSFESLENNSGDKKDNLMENIPDLVESLLEKVFLAKASDLHIDPEKDGSRIRFRIDGMLHTQQEHLTMAQHAAVASRIKIITLLDQTSSIRKNSKNL